MAKYLPDKKFANRKAKAVPKMIFNKFKGK